MIRTIIGTIALALVLLAFWVLVVSYVLGGPGEFIRAFYTSDQRVSPGYVRCYEHGLNWASGWTESGDVCHYHEGAVHD